MKLGPRQIANVILVLVVGGVAMIWAAVSLAGIHFGKPKHLTVQLTSSGGALPGSEVSYLGVPIGKVDSAHLVDNALELNVTYRPKGPIAKVLRADVRQKSSLGEPYLDLSPADKNNPTPGDPNGERIPVERTTVPRPLHTLLDQMNETLKDVQPSDLAQLTEGLSGIVGHEQDVQTLLSSWADVGDVMGRRHVELGQLLSEAAKMSASLNANRDQLAGALSGYAQLGQVLANRTNELDRILNNGAKFGTDASDLLAKTDKDLKQGVLPGLDTTFHSMAAKPTKIRETWYWVPEFMEKIGYVLDGTTMNIGVGNSMPLAPGMQPNFAVPIYGEGLRLDKIFLPTVAQKIEVDLGPRKQPMMAYRILSPDEAAYAMKGPAETKDIQAKKQAELQNPKAPSENP